MKKLRLLIFLICTVTLLGCNRDANLDDAVLLQIKLNESAITPPASEFILEDKLTRSNTLTTLETSSRITQLNAGVPFNLNLDYETTMGFTHVGFRIGSSGEFWLVPVAGVSNSKKGQVSYQIQMPDDVCLGFPTTCSPIAISEFIAIKSSNGNYLISNMFSFELTMVCGDCDEPSCRNFQTACNSSGEQCQDLSKNLADYKEFFDKAIAVGDTIGYCSFVNRYITTLKSQEYQSCIEDNLAIFSAAEFPMVLKAIENDQQIICH